MSKGKDQAHSEDRLKFLLALMTRDYENAMKHGTSVLRENPNDLGVLKTLSAVQDKVVNSLAESAGDESDEDIPDEENMQTSYDTTSDSDTESDETDKDDPITIDTTKYHQNGTLPTKNLSDRIKSHLFSHFIKEGGIRDYDFKKKIYRILAVKTDDKFTSKVGE